MRASCLNPVSGLTLEAWFRPGSWAGAGYEPIVEKPCLQHVAPHYQYTLGATGEAYPGVYDHRFNAAAAIVPDYPKDDVHTPLGFWSPGRWYHVAATYNGASITLYINGSPVDSCPVSGPLAAFDTPLTIGHHLNFRSGLIGVIDEVRVWAVARTSEEIAAKYNCIIDPGTPGLVGYWNFDEPSGQYIHDQSLCADHGTLGMTAAPGADDPLRVPSSAPLVPGPAALSLLTFGGLALIRRRR